MAILTVTDTEALMRFLPPLDDPETTIERFISDTGERDDSEPILLKNPGSHYATVVEPDLGLRIEPDGEILVDGLVAIFVLDRAPDPDVYPGPRSWNRPDDALVSIVYGYGAGETISLTDLAARTTATGDLETIVDVLSNGRIVIRSPAGLGEAYDMGAAVDVAALGDDVRITAFGSSGDDTLVGGDGEDVLWSRAGPALYAGRDVLKGGDGGDTYRVALGDARERTGPDGLPLPDPSVQIVDEADGTGRDEVIVSGTRFDLRGTHVEDLVLADPRTSTASDRSPMEGIGSDAANVLTGSVRQRYERDGDTQRPDGPLIPLLLSGLGGDDTITGNGAALHLIGGEGDDLIRAKGPSFEERDVGRGYFVRIEGGDGDDELEVFGFYGRQALPPDTPPSHVHGGAGNDFIVLLSGRDVDIDGGAGRDEVRITTMEDRDIVLTGVEIVSLKRDSPGQITATEGVEIMRGSRNQDTLDTGSIEDVILSGGDGDDLYVLRAEGAQIGEAFGRGTDRVESHGVSYTLDAFIEETALVGEASSARLVGNAGRNILTGDAGDNLLYGRDGPNTLTGGDGADVFVINAQYESPEWITDFVSGEDRVRWVGLDGIDVTAAARADALVQGEAATEAEHRLIFDAATGALSYDADGTGEAEARLIATFEGLASLTAGDLSLI